MKVDFNDTKTPPSSYVPLPKLKVFEGAELEEIRERMRKWLREGGTNNGTTITS